MPTDLRSNQVDRLVTKDQDHHGRRTRNAADALLAQDYVTLRQVDSKIAAIGGGSNAVSTGKTYSLAANGTLAIAADIAPRVEIIDSGKATGVKITLKTAPTGTNCVVEIYQNSILWATLTILDGLSSVVASAAAISGYALLTSGNYWRIDILSVGSAFPGSDIVVTIGV